MLISSLSAYVLGQWLENDTAPVDEQVVVSLLLWG